MAHPPAPWNLRGDMWVTVLAVPSAHRASGPGGHRPRGLYGCALVDYRPGGVLTYRELLVARLRRPITPRVTITDIWVDSATSLEGGRALWAIPKDMARLDLVEDRGGTGRARGIEADVVLPADARTPGPVAGVRARTVGAPRLPAPFTFGTVQRREHVPDAPSSARGEVRTPVSGRARLAPVRATWRFARGGALEWLDSARPVGSFVLADFDLSFG